MNPIETEPIRISQRDARLFVFGDSYSDIGNLFTLTGSRLPVSPPYFDGRFSNGPVATESLASSLGFTLNQSTSFAIGGANTGRNNDNSDTIQRFGG